MVLFHDVVAVFPLPDDEVGAVCLVVARAGRCMGVTAVAGHLLRDPMPADGLLQQPERRLLIAMLRAQTVHGLALLIHGTIEGVPPAFHLTLGLVHPPPDPPGTLPAMKRLFHQGTVWHDPALDRRGVDRDPTLLPQLFDMPIAQRGGDLPAHAPENAVLGKMGPLAADRHCRSPSLGTLNHRERAYPKSTHMKIATKPQKVL
jgi:hypothetical protein